MNKRRDADIWSVEKEEFKIAVVSSKTFKEVCERLNIKIKCRNYKSLSRRIAIEGLNTDHFEKPFANAGRYIRKTLRPLQEVMVEGSDYSRYHLKKRLLDNGLLKNQCYKCGLDGVWNGEPIVMILDHINGKNNDNRLENLRMVCPNCNSQLPTFSGRNCKKENKFCGCCNAKIFNGNKSGFCKKCFQKHSKKEQSKRPSKEILLQELKNSSWTAVGEKYGVSDNAIRKWAKGYGMPSDKSISNFSLDYNS